MRGEERPSSAGFSFSTPAAKIQGFSRRRRREKIVANPQVIRYDARSMPGCCVTGVEVDVLGRMREHAKALSVTLWVVIFALIGTTFLVWGYRSTSGGLAPDTIATVEGERVPYSEYQQAYQRQYQQYQQAMGDKFDEKILERLNIKAQIAESLIARHLLLHEAKRLGLVVGADELVAEITNLPAFNDKDGFSRARYLRVLESARMSPEKFEVGLRQDLMIRKIEQWVKGAVHVLPDEASESFRFNRASVKAEYLLVSDIQAQQPTIQRLGALLKEKKPWEELVRSSGLKPLSSEFFTWTQEVKRVPDQETFKEAALALEKGEISPVIQTAKAAYLIRVIDRKDPDAAQYEREKSEYGRNLLNRKREQVFNDWVRQLRARAKVKIEQANL